MRRKGRGEGGVLSGGEKGGDGGVCLGSWFGLVVLNELGDASES